jgi:hypothetical protein
LTNTATTPPTSHSAQKPKHTWRSTLYLYAQTTGGALFANMFFKLYVRYRAGCPDERSKRWLQPDLEYLLCFFVLMCFSFVVWVNVKDTRLGEILGWADEKDALLGDERTREGGGKNSAGSTGDL